MELVVVLISHRELPVADDVRGLALDLRHFRVESNVDVELPAEVMQVIEQVLAMRKHFLKRKTK